MHKCQHCGGQVIVDEYDKRSACLQCGRGEDWTTEELYAGGVAREGAERHTGKRDYYSTTRGYDMSHLKFIQRNGGL